MMQYFLILSVCFGSLASSARQTYLGCFKSDLNQVIPAVLFGVISSPAQCTQECKSRYFMYAALIKGGQQCYCVEEYSSMEPSNGCSNVPCTLDKTKFCGSDEAMSIYTTGQRGPSPPRSLQITERLDFSLLISWLPPERPNGNVTSYTLRRQVITTFASISIPPSRLLIEGGKSNSTILTNLQPGTQYNISLTAKNIQEESTPVFVLYTTRIGPPEKPAAPKVLVEHNSDSSSASPTMIVSLEEGRSNNGPLSGYQVAVIASYLVAPTDNNVSYPDYTTAMKQGVLYYITAEFDANNFKKYQRFVVGDGRNIGGYYNAPLKEPFDKPQISLVLVSRFQGQVQYSYSDTTTMMMTILHNRLADDASKTSTRDSSVAVGLTIAIALLGMLLVIAVLALLILKRRHEQIRMSKLPEQQELTEGPNTLEVDNMGYIPEDVPERPNHYHELKSKVWIIPRTLLDIESTVIRRGKFGTVQPGVVQQDRQGRSVKVVVHCIADKALRASEKRHMLRDVDVCIRTGSMKYLASFVGNCETPDMLYVVLEAAPWNLKARLLAARSGQVFPYEHILPIGAAIASGLSYLEAHKVVHSHLCARSVGLADDFTPKISGFGMGKYSIDDVKLARWTAPERFGHKKHQPSVVWAFAVVIWEMMSMGATPYNDLEDECDVEEAVVEKFVRLPQLPDMPDPLYEVLLSCWHIEADERPLFDELARLNTLSICPITAITQPYIAELELN